MFPFNFFLIFFMILNLMVLKDDPNPTKLSTLPPSETTLLPFVWFRREINKNF